MYFLWVLIAIIALGAVAAGANYLRSLRGDDDAPTVNPADMECCGQHEVCEKESLLAALSQKIEYFDDEELDRFRGRASDQYTEAEADEFRDVLYTMRETEVAAWVRSLQLRQVELPDGVKDEVVMIVGELREAPGKK